MATQGRCHKCDTHYVWDGDVPMALCKCPDCYGRLRRTSSQTTCRLVKLGRKSLVDRRVVCIASRDDFHVLRLGKKGV